MAESTLTVDPGYQIDPGGYQPPDPIADVHPTGHGLIPHQASPEFSQETGISPDQYDTFRGYLAQRESNRYDEPPNNLGYMGRYQMGPEEISQASQRLGMPVPNTQQFLSNPQLQENLFENYTLDHHRQMMQNPAYANGNSVQRMALLAGAHLGGPGGVAAWQHGEDRQDENGTSVGNYIQGMGQLAAQTITPTSVNQSAGSGRPVPNPQPKPDLQKGGAPVTIGPFPDTFSAYEAKPQNAEAYHLLESNGQFSWVPGSQTTANPMANLLFNPGQTEKILNQGVVKGPQSFPQHMANFVGNTGVSFNRSIANLLDLPSNLADRALDAIAAGTGTKRLDVHFGNPIENVMNRMGFETVPHDTGDIFGNVAGVGVGSGLGAALPFLVGGAIAQPLAEAATAAEPAPMASLLARASGNPGTNFGTEMSTAAGAGVGQQEAHDWYKGQTGREGDLGDVMTQILGGGAWNAVRLSLITAGEKALMPAFQRAWQTGKNALGIPTEGQVAQYQQAMDPVTGAKIADRVLSEQLRNGLNEADRQVAALSTVPTSDSASYLADKSQQAVKLVNQFAGASRETERNLWSDVNTEMPRDFTATKGLFRDLKQDFSTRPATGGSFPSDFNKLLGENGSIADIDTLGRGQDVRAALNHAIENEMATGGQRAVNAARLGALQKIRNQLGQDLEGTEGVNPDEIDNYRKALTFSRARSTLMESDEMRDFLNTGDSTALEKLVKAGPAGADAVQILTGAAQTKYGTDGLLGVTKDVLRQKYANAAAPNGYITLKGHNQFMNRYGAILDNPAFQDVKDQFNAAATAEQDLNAIPGFGKQTSVSGSTIEKRMDAAEAYLSAPTETVLKHLENVTAPDLATRRVLQSMDNSPDAQKGFMHVVAQKALDDPSYIEKNPGIFSGIDKMNPGFTDRAIYYTQPSTVSGLAGQLIRIAPAYFGARIGNAIAEGGGMGSHLLMAQRFSKVGENTFRAITDQISKISSANIVDPAAHDAWNRITANAPQTAMSKAADMMLLHAYVPGLALQEATPTNDAGSGLPGSRAMPGGPLSPGGKSYWHSIFAPGAGAS